MIEANDEHCRAILVRVPAPLAEATALLAAVKSPWVRGFIGGDSIFSSAAEACLTGQDCADSAGSAGVDIAARFRTLLAAWVAQRSPH